MARTLIAHLAAVVALIATILLGVDVAAAWKDPAKAVIIVLAIIATLVLAAIDVTVTARNLPKSFRGENRDAKIRAYMGKLISKEWRCVVSSNDLSWVRGEVREIMFEKARRGSLELVMPVATELSAELVAAGAVAHYYGTDDFKFESRFTLVNPDSRDSWVAIGQGTSKAHLIREIHPENIDPTLDLAKDLIKIARRTAGARASE